MIDTFLKLIDKIIEVVKRRKQRSKDILTDIVEPLFSEMALVVDDYLSLFLDTIEAVDQGTDEALATAIQKVTARRYKLLTTRIKVQEMARVLTERYQKKILTEFAEEIVAFFHSSQIRPYRSGSTPSKDLLVELHDFLARPDFDRATLKPNLTQATRNIEVNWAKITRAYCRIKVAIAR
jgi:hypothetical protein